ncbi:MAG: formylglycine-generating enzyme family protein [Nitrospirae bacterium]|nr:formylglycine-generating enzyme family protein [Nitrospirota bacterium]
MMTRRLLIATIALLAFLIAELPHKAYAASLGGRGSESKKADEEGGAPSIKFRQVDPFGELAVVPAGKFIMGSADEEIERAWKECTDKYPACQRSIFEAEGPEHAVYLDEFMIDRFDITNIQYFECVMDEECTRPHKDKFLENPKYANYPVVYVDWHQAYNYCNWAGGRLPTEAEWEKAARGIEIFRYPWGNDFEEERAVWNTTSPSAVGQKGGMSPYRAYDMAGNVWNWVQDWYSPNAYTDSAFTNPKGPDKGIHKVFRGGSWASDLSVFLRTTIRNHDKQGMWNAYTGFRCVKDIDRKAPPKKAAIDEKPAGR